MEDFDADQWAETKIAEGQELGFSRLRAAERLLRDLREGGYHWIRGPKRCDAIFAAADRVISETRGTRWHLSERIKAWTSIN